MNYDWTNVHIIGEKTDEILTMIEDELVTMQQYYDDNSKLLKLVLRRTHLWEQQCEILVCILGVRFRIIFKLNVILYIITYLN